jgi:hypothetical protein
MKYDMNVDTAKILMRGLIYAMEDEDATEYAKAEFQIEWYLIGEAFDLLDEDQIEEMDSVIDDMQQIKAEIEFELGYQRSSITIKEG